MGRNRNFTNKSNFYNLIQFENKCIKNIERIKIIWLNLFKYFSRSIVREFLFLFIPVYHSRYITNFVLFSTRNLGIHPITVDVTFSLNNFSVIFFIWSFNPLFLKKDGNYRIYFDNTSTNVSSITYIYLL